MTETITAIAIRDTVTGRIWIGGVIHYDLFAQAVTEIGPVMLSRLMPGLCSVALAVRGLRQSHSP